MGADAFAVVLERGGRRQAFVIEGLQAGHLVPSARAPRAKHVVWRVVEGLWGTLVSCWWVMSMIGG